MKSFVVYFEGRIEIEAETESEAINQAFRSVQNAGGEFQITGAEEV